MSAPHRRQRGRRPRQRHVRRRARHAIEAVRLAARLARRGLGESEHGRAAASRWAARPWFRNEPTPTPRQREHQLAEYRTPSTAFSAGGEGIGGPEPIAPRLRAGDVRRLRFPSQLAPAHDSDRRLTTELPDQRDGTLLLDAVCQDGPTMAPRRVPFNGPLYHPTTRRRRRPRRRLRRLAGIRSRAQRHIKENNLYQWASTPLERLSAFANGHFDISDTMRVTGRPWSRARRRESSLGSRPPTSISGPRPFRSVTRSIAVDANPLRRHPGLADRRERQRHRRCRRPDASRVYDQRPLRRRVRCAGHGGHAVARRPARLHDSEAWPTSPDVYNLLHEPAGPNDDHLGAAARPTSCERARRWPLDDQHHDDDELLVRHRRRACRAATISGTSRSPRAARTTSSTSSARCGSRRIATCSTSPNFGAERDFRPQSVRTAASPRARRPARRALPIIDEVRAVARLRADDLARL